MIGCGLVAWLYGTGGGGHFDRPDAAVGQCACSGRHETGHAAMLSCHRRAGWVCRRLCPAADDGVGVLGA